MFDWILRNLDEPTAGEPTEDVAQEEAAPDTEEVTEEVEESDEPAPMPSSTKAKRPTTTPS